MEDNDIIQSLNSTVNSIVSNKTSSSSTSTLSTTSTTSSDYPVPNYSKSNSSQHKNNNNYKYRKENGNNNHKYRSQTNSSPNYSLSQQPHYHHKKKYRDPSFIPREFQFSPKVPCTLIDFVGGVNYTQSHDNGVIFNRVVNFFRNITTTIEQEEKLLDFNFFLRERSTHNNSITNSKEGFYVTITQSDPTRFPPVKRRNCLSCDTESETNLFSKLAYPLTTREEVSICHNLWFDAKARPMFIITPKRHIERLSDCNDQEIFSMFLLAVQTIEQETRISNAHWNGIRFVGMTLNHGNARNLEHLHLKIRINGGDFDHFKKFGWDDEKMERFKILKNGIYKRDERLNRIS
ncbi:11304_t:CDS:1 [Funneliformis geosporum]|uniref:4343_t:CDS:1 n=1 Tax=Funneliformis geosporum TaxID=1117311 RepID=A0A9W4SP24_9GLOM|nr:11304_t:CDS:1 [Funneliformis geosporum]CAI2176107.1 4343_t:CDS:1 [Funneliformis geosporum]